MKTLSRRDPQKSGARRAPSAAEGTVHELEGRLETLREQLHTTQKLASFGTMAVMVAHEYNNLATPLLSYAQYALNHDDPALLRSALETVVRRVRAISDLSSRILDFAGPASADLETVPIRVVVDHSLETLARDLAKDRIRVRIDIEDALTARARANALEQVLFNLILNARQAMFGRTGTLSISARRAADAVVELTVRDTGPGIPPEHIDRLFTPLFTTKRNADRPDQHGVGLGLVVCKDLLEQMGGRIRAESTPGQGAAFIVTLPAE